MIDTQTVQILGLVLIHFIWQGLLIGLLFSSVRLVLKGESAVARYNWGVVCLILLALAPFLTCAWLLNNGGYSSASDLVIMSEAFQVGAVSAPGSSELTLSLLLPWIVGVWLFGVLLMSARLSAGWWYVRQLRRRADHSVPASIRGQLDRLAARLNFARQVGLAYSSQIAGPMLIGLFKPLILLPTGLINGLSPRQVEMVLAHELSHLHRADHLVNLFQNIVETLLFYHPVVRWISSDVRAERELASDEQAARLTGDRVGYAETLLQLERVRGDRLSVAIGMADHQLVTRVRYLLAPQSRQSGSVVFGMTMLTVLLAGALTALVSTGLQSFSERDASGVTPLSAIGESTDIEIAGTNHSSNVIDEHPSTVELPQSEKVTDEIPQVSAVAPLPEPVQAGPSEPIKPAVPLEQIRLTQAEPVMGTTPVPAKDEPISQPKEIEPVEPVSHESETSQAGPALAMASLDVPVSAVPIRGGELLSGPVPDYPEMAARRNQEGRAEVRLTIGRDGRVVDVTIVQESPHGFGFGDAALQAVEQWRFEPFTRNGQAIPHEIRTGFDFTDPPSCGRATGTRISRC